jgi:hypothetical protein
MSRRRRKRPSPSPPPPPAAVMAPEVPEGPPRAVQRAASGPVRLIAGLVLLGAAVYLRSVNGLSFANITTGEYSANNLLRGVADDWPVLKSLTVKLFGIFAVENLLPALVLLLPAVFLIAGGLAGRTRGDKDVLSFMRNGRTRLLVLAVLFVAGLAGGLGLHFAVVGAYPPVGDEFCYQFGADHLAAGRLFVDSPPLRDHFQAWSIINDGRWYSKVTVGWPLLLALGRTAGLPFLVNALLAAFTVVLLFLIGERLYGAEGGLLAALWGLVTPFFIMSSGTYFPHTAAALFSLLFVYLLLRTFEADRWIFPALAGLAMTMLLLVRPADAVVLFISLAPLMAYHLVRAQDRMRAVRKLGLLAVLSLIGIGLLLAVNAAQNGHPLVFGYQKYLAGERWGFGPNGHTVLRGLWHTAYSLMRAGAWGVPLVGLFTAVSLFTRKWSLRMLVLPVLGGLALYAGYFTLAVFEIGPRYYLTMYLLALVPAAGGAVLVRDALARKRVPGANAFLATLALGTVLFTGIGLWPRLAASVRSQTSTLAKVSRLLADPPVESPSLIFLRDHMYLKNTYLTRNYPSYRSSRHVYVLYLTPEDNEKVLALFPDRKSYSTFVNPATGELEFLPGVDDSLSASSYVAAGLNYVEFDPHRAAEAFRRAYELEPAEPAIMMNLARAYDLAGDKANAVAMYARFLQTGATDMRDPALFALATALRDLGEPGEALKVYAELAGSGADASYRDRAAAWVDKLAGK